jgi:hypothetical protein
LAFNDDLKGRPGAKLVLVNNLATAKQAFILLSAATSMDTRAHYALPEMIRLACTYGKEDNSRQVLALLTNYLDNSSDLEVTRRAVSYLLEQLNTKFSLWLQSVYHTRLHSSTGMTPTERYQRGAHLVKALDPHLDLDQLFYHQ